MTNGERDRWAEERVSARVCPYVCGHVCAFLCLGVYMCLRPTYVCLCFCMHMFV